MCITPRLLLHFPSYTQLTITYTSIHCQFASLIPVGSGVRVRTFASDVHSTRWFIEQNAYSGNIKDSSVYLWTFQKSVLVVFSKACSLNCIFSVRARKHHCFGKYTMNILNFKFVSTIIILFDETCIQIFKLRFFYWCNGENTRD